MEKMKLYKKIMGVLKLVSKSKCDSADYMNLKRSAL